MIASPARRVEIRDIVSAAKVQWDSMVCLHILDCDVAAAISAVTTKLDVNALPLVSSQFLRSFIVLISFLLQAVIFYKFAYSVTIYLEYFRDFRF